MKFLSLILVLLLTSCATPVKKQKELLISKNICCNSMVEFDYKSMAISEAVTLKFNEKSPVYDFGYGKTYFSALTLPLDIEAPYINVKSYFNGSLIGQYFDPIFLVLNEKHERIKEFSLRLRFRDVNMFTNPNANMAGVFKFPEGAKYLIIFTRNFNNEAPVAELAASTSMVMVGNAPMVFSNQGESIQLERSPTGSIQLELLDQDGS